jgi:SAM-dependent methyltransferase
MTVGPDYFEKMYAASADPWGLGQRWYERRKYALTLAMLPAERYRRAFEPGCSVGVLTEQLAARCDRLLAWDAATVAVKAARERTAAWPQVQVQQRSVPADWPEGTFDLIVLSELLYYFGTDDMDRVLSLAARSLEDDGALVAVHWRHPVAEYPWTGDDVHDVLSSRPGLRLMARYTDADFLAEVYARADVETVSVAAATGLL